MRIMNLHTSLLFVTAMLVLFACKTNKSGSAATTASTNDTLVSTKSQHIIKDKELFAATTEAIRVDTCYVLGSDIMILTGKINACDADNFNLVWNGAMAKSLPPKTSLKILLQADPACKEQHRFLLKFSGKDLKWKSDSTASGSILFRIGGYDKEMLYNF